MKGSGWVGFVSVEISCFGFVVFIVFVILVFFYLVNLVFSYIDYVGLDNDDVMWFVEVCDFLNG